MDRSLDCFLGRLFRASLQAVTDVTTNIVVIQIQTVSESFPSAGPGDPFMKPAPELG